MLIMIAAQVLKYSYFLYWPICNLTN